MSKSSKSFKNIALGAAVAGAAGYLAGLLTAPKSGQATRKDIKKTADKAVDDVESQLKALHDELNTLMKDARGKGDELSGKAQKEIHDIADKAKDGKGKAHEVLKAARNGDVSDKDLKKAVADAKKAIEHVKDYLKK